MSGQATIGHPHSGGKRWLAPPGLAAIAARLLALRRPGRDKRARFDEALAAARSCEAILATEFRNLAVIAGSLRSRVTVALPADGEYEGLARAVRRFASGIARLDPADPNLSKESLGESALLIPVCEPPQAGWSVDEVAALVTRVSRPVFVLTVNARRTFSLEQGLPAGIDVAIGGAEAVAFEQIAPMKGPAGQSLVAEAIRRALGGAEPGRRRLGGAAAFPIPLPLVLYRMAMSVLSPFAWPYLLLRSRRGKEISARLGERFGRSPLARPEGRLVWVHGASVGESVSVLPLINALLGAKLADAALVTTGTVSSARIMDQRLPERAFHQFAPLDAPRYARRFLDHWRPDLAVLVESELWPNLMIEAARHEVPLALVNGRLSERSFARWSRFPRSVRAILATVRLVLAQSAAHATRFALLGAGQVRHDGNLKFDCPAPPADQSDHGELDEAMRIRPVWLAASTHEGEEAAIVDVHIAARERFPNLLTVIVPRHPERGGDVAHMFEDRSFTVAQRSAGDAIGPDVDIYVADTIGELGLFYRLIRIAFVGGSLVPVGGHNPIEPAQLGCAILHGPHVHNFVDMYDSFDASGGSIPIDTPVALGEALAALLSDPQRFDAMVVANRSVIEQNAGSLARTVDALRPLIER